MKSVKILNLILICLLFSLTIGCKSKGDKNNETLDIIFCPGITYSSGAQAHKMIYSSINRDNAEGYLIDTNDKVMNGSTLLPSQSSMYSISDNRCFVENDKAISGNYQLIPTIGGNTLTPIVKHFAWDEEPYFSPSPSITINDAGVFFKSMQIDFGKLKNIPENTSVSYRIKIYQFEKGGNLYEMSEQQTSANSIQTTFKGGDSHYPVLEALIYHDNKPIMAIHYILPAIN